MPVNALNALADCPNLVTLPCAVETCPSRELNMEFAIDLFAQQCRNIKEVDFGDYVDQGVSENTVFRILQSGLHVKSTLLRSHVVAFYSLVCCVDI